jgi:hypothetical protein
VALLSSDNQNIFAGNSEMPMLLAAALMMAQAAVPPASPTVQPAQITVKKNKPKEVCEYMEVTGSHARQRVCHNSAGDLELPGVSEAGPNPGMIHAIPGAAKGGLGGTPQ